jgi:hypothetical protein
MISPAIRRRLIDALVPVSQTTTFAGRTALLAGIPSQAFARDENNQVTDITNLISLLEDNYGEQGEWRLLQFIDNALATVKGAELGNTIVAIRGELELGRPKKQNLSDVLATYLFDLKKPVLQCLSSLPDEARMSGFLLPVPTRDPLPHFCNSLKHHAIKFDHWKRDQVLIPGTPPEIRQPHTSVEDAFKIALNHKVRLQKKSVIWSVYANDPGDAEALWRKLQHEFNCKISNSFIVVFGMPAEAPAPAGLLPLPAPVFTPKDVSDWVGSIIESLAWQERVKVKERWTRLIIADCSVHADGLPIGRIYEQLNYHCGLLTENQTEEAFLSSLDDLEPAGE